MRRDRDLLLMREWPRPGRRAWLAIDLLTGDRIHELKAPDAPPVETPGAVLVSDSVSECRELTGGGLLVPEGWLWSLLDPLDASPVVEILTDDRFQVESSLRAVARRFRNRQGSYKRFFRG